MQATLCPGTQNWYISRKPDPFAKRFDQNISPTVSKEEARQTLGLDINTHIVGSLGAFFSIKTLSY